MQKQKHLKQSALHEMETRRLVILCSHLRPTIAASSRLSHVSTLSCDATFRDAKKGIAENDCAFCKIVLGEASSLKLYEDDTCICILDTNPLSHGHSLIIPKSHYPSLQATPSSVVAAMCSKVPFISNAIMKATDCDSFNLLVNNGAAAGQVIFHTHIHIIPRKARDHLWASESLQRQPLKFDDKASRLAYHIREQLEMSIKDLVSQKESETMD